MPSRGLYYKPTFLSNVHPTSIVAQQESSVRARRHDIPHPRKKRSNWRITPLTVWSASCVRKALTCRFTSRRNEGRRRLGQLHDMFDAACGFGGSSRKRLRREAAEKACSNISADVVQKRAQTSVDPLANGAAEVANPAIDRTVKLYIGGKQAARFWLQRRSTRRRIGHSRRSR